MRVNSFGEFPRGRQRRTVEFLEPRLFGQPRSSVLQRLVVAKGHICGSSGVTAVRAPWTASQTSDTHRLSAPRRPGSVTRNALRPTRRRRIPTTRVRAVQAAASAPRRVVGIKHHRIAADTPRRVVVAGAVTAAGPSISQRRALDLRCPCSHLAHPRESTPNPRRESSLGDHIAPFASPRTRLESRGRRLRRVLRSSTVSGRGPLSDRLPPAVREVACPPVDCVGATCSAAWSRRLRSHVSTHQLCAASLGSMRLVGIGSVPAIPLLVRLGLGLARAIRALSFSFAFISAT